jgi:hypothetical protein
MKLSSIIIIAASAIIMHSTSIHAQNQGNETVQELKVNKAYISFTIKADSTIDIINEAKGIQEYLTLKTSLKVTNKFNLKSRSFSFKVNLTDVSQEKSVLHYITVLQKTHQAKFTGIKTNISYK